jgi:hypothetical protein
MISQGKQPAAKLLKIKGSGIGTIIAHGSISDNRRNAVRMRNWVLFAGMVAMLLTGCGYERDISPQAVVEAPELTGTFTGYFEASGNCGYTQAMNPQFEFRNMPNGSVYVVIKYAENSPRARTHRAYGYLKFYKNGRFDGQIEDYSADGETILSVIDIQGFTTGGVEIVASWYSHTRNQTVCGKDDFGTFGTRLP